MAGRAGGILSYSDYKKSPLDCQNSLVSQQQTQCPRVSEEVVWSSRASSSQLSFSELTISRSQQPASALAEVGAVKAIKFQAAEASSRRAYSSTSSPWKCDN